jgi:hypothetical protein
MNCYCFEIDWDKAPEWIQAISAVIAAIGLVITLRLQLKTLREQQKSLKEQQIITQLEQKRFLDSRLPILELSNIDYIQNKQDREVKFSITIKENYLQNLKISHNFPEDHVVVIPFYINDVILPKEYVFNFEINFTLSEVFIEIEVYTGNTIIFNFEDAFGNKYEQYLIYKGAKNLFMHPAFNI